MNTEYKHLLVVEGPTLMQIAEAILQKESQEESKVTFQVKTSEGEVSSYEFHVQLLSRAPFVKANGWDMWEVIAYNKNFGNVDFYYTSLTTVKDTAYILPSLSL